MNGPASGGAGPPATARWRLAVPFVIGLVLWVLPVPAGLGADAWRYFAVFAGAIVALMLTPWPGGAVGLAAVSLLMALGVVHDDPARSVAWALASFSDTTVWLTFGAFLFATGYRKSGLGRRIALRLVHALGRRTLGLGYAIALSDLALAPGTPSNTARSGGTIFPIVQQIPPLYGSEPGPTAGRIGTFVMWTAFASTAVTSSMFITALVPNAAALALAAQTVGLDMGWWRFTLGFAPVGLLLLALVPPLALALTRPTVRDGAATVAWAGAQLRAMGPVSRAEWTMAALVLLAIALWVTGSNPRVALPLLGSNFIHPTGVVLLAAVAMLLLGVITWNDLVGEREAWSVFLYFAMVLTLADGLNRTGFIAWLAGRFAVPLQGVDPRLATVALLALFYWSHYLFASITSHALAVLPVVLAVARGAARPRRAAAGPAVHLLARADGRDLALRHRLRAHLRRQRLHRSRPLLGARGGVRRDLLRGPAGAGVAVARRGAGDPLSTAAPSPARGHRRDSPSHPTRPPR